MKKIILILMVSLLMTGCGKQSEGDVLKEFKENVEFHSG